MSIELYIVLAILVVAALWLATTFNKLVGIRTRMEEGWSGIDVFLKKRYDLLPNLMDVVQQYAAHEQETLEGVMRCRAQAMQAKGPQDQIAAEKGLAGALGRLMMVAENYPNLKADQTFLNLQRNLSEIEEQIAAARRAFSSAIYEYNNTVKTIPANIIAGIFGFQERAFFEIGAAERQTVPVSL